MGTANFFTENANCVYAIDTNVYDENGESCISDFIYDDIRNEVSKKLEKIAKENNWNWYEDDRAYDNDRNYPAQKIGDLIASFYFWSYEVKIILIPYTRAGYYTGFNLDYGIEIYVDGEDIGYYDGDYSLENVENEFIKCLRYYDREREIELFKANFYKCERKLELLKELMSEKVEEIYKEVSTPLYTYARASNGETLYASCNA